MASTAARPVAPAPFIDKVPSLPPKKGGILPTRSPLLKEIAKAERREWKFPPLRRFVRPVLASLLVGIVLSGLVLGGIYVTKFVSQSAEPGTQPPPPPLTPSKTYTLSTNVVPETGGEIRIVSPSSSSGTFEPNSQITLMAIPNGCYTFSYWDGASGSSETINIVMDSNKSVTAHFRLKEPTPPAISEVKATSYSDVSATITWETDKPATSHVEYGKTKDYGLSAKSNGAPTTSHKVRLTALEPSTTYYFMVKSADKCGNEATKTEMLTTLPEILVGDRVGNRAPDFVLPEYQDNNNPGAASNGELVKLSDFKGKKILLNFWNTFCGACIGEFPYIRAIYEDKNWADKNSADSDFVVVTVCIDERADRADRIAKLEDKYRDEAGPFTFPILLDTEENPTKDSYHVWTIPKTVFIDSDGIIREIKMGRFKDEGEIIDILNRLD
jgi:thiol-disulfide isomerase/thioredoxin